MLLTLLVRQGAASAVLRARITSAKEAISRLPGQIVVMGGRDPGNIKHHRTTAQAMDRLRFTRLCVESLQ